MTQLQNEVLSEYVKMLGNPPLRVISENTGINMSRIFRLYNGSEMSLKEYQVFKNEMMRIKEISSLDDLIERCLYKLSKDKLSKIVVDLERSLVVSSVVGG